MTVITKAAPALMNYDPNLTLCGRMAKQTVRLTFGQWQYRTSMEVVVGGNCNGLSVIECAIGLAYEQLGEIPFFNDDTGEDDVMAVINVGELQCMDECLEGEDWLKEMLIGAEIINIEPEAEQ
ncbi:DUF5406 domain-containing protein [Serratia liquefaciens]|uniref:DUF5406 domain-containing protein n=1 Tax=Serratia liquefaciens TaxID=614 RepID=UPI0021833601|nr:DUF5406 domain-containing protein [Serratia liquefaciens]CAI2419414.1 Uncharacterised protein [Serratia liquefaciens]